MGRNRTEVSEVILKYTVDDSDAQDRADAVVQQLKDLESQAEQLKRELKSYGNELEQVARAEMQLARASGITDDSLDRTTTQLRQAENAARDYGDAYRMASDDVEAFGDVATNISQISGLARAAGAGGAADVAMIGADIADAVEGIRRLGPALADTATKATNAFNNLTGLNASTGQLAIAAAGATAAIAIVAIALTQQIQAVQAEAQRQAELTQAQILAQRRAREFLVSATSADVDERIRQLREQLDLENSLRLEYKDEAIQLARDLSDQATVFFGGARGEDIDTLEEARALIDNVATSTGSLNQENADAIANFTRYADAAQAARVNVRDLGEELLALDTATAAAEIAANDAAKAEDDLRMAREAETAATKEASEAVLAAREAARTRDEEFARAQIQTQLDALDAARELAQLEDELADIRKRGAQQASALKDASMARVEGLEDGLEKFLTDTDKKIAAEQDKLNSKRIKIEQDYMRQSLEDTAKFLDEERKLESSHSKERIRLLEDLQENLLQAEEENNVIAFIRARRAGEKNLRRFDEDAKGESRTRSEQFKAEQEQGKVEAAQRLIDLRTQSRDRIAALRSAAEERRQLTDQQIAEERAALSQRLIDLDQAIDIEQQQRKQAWNDSLREQQIYNQQRADLERKLAQQLAVIAANTYSSITALERPGTIGGAFGGARPVGTSLTGGAFTPRQLNSGLSRGARSGGGGVTIGGNVTIGGEVTLSDFKRGMQEAFGAISRGAQRAKG